MSLATSRVILSVSAREAYKHTKTQLTVQQNLMSRHSWSIHEVENIGLKILIFVPIWKLDLTADLTLCRASYLSNKLHYFSQVLLLLQNLLGFCPQGNKFREMFVVIFIQRSSVLAVTDQPVDRREVFPLSQLLVQPPEHLSTEEERLTDTRKNRQRCFKTRAHRSLTWTIPNVAEVTGSEKSPPGGDTLKVHNMWEEEQNFPLKTFNLLQWCNIMDYNKNNVAQVLWVQ